MTRRRASPRDPTSGPPPLGQVRVADGSAPNVLWLKALSGWAGCAEERKWSGPRPEMIAAALVLAEIAASRARLARRA
jgi:hypothetical protein